MKSNDPNELAIFSRERKKLAYEKRISDNQEFR